MCWSDLNRKWMLISPIKISKIVILWLIVFRIRRNCARNSYRNKQKNIELGEINGGLIAMNMNVHIGFKLVEKIDDYLSILCKIYYYLKFTGFYFKIWITINPMSPIAVFSHRLSMNKITKTILFGDKHIYLYSLYFLLSS